MIHMHAEGKGLSNLHALKGKHLFNISWHQHGHKKENWPWNFVKIIGQTGNNLPQLELFFQGNGVTSSPSVENPYPAGFNVLWKFWKISPKKIQENYK